MNRHPLNNCGFQLDQDIYQDQFPSYFLLSFTIQRQLALWKIVNYMTTFNRTLTPTYLSRHPDALVMVTGDFNLVGASFDEKLLKRLSGLRQIVNVYQK